MQGRIGKAKERRSPLRSRSRGVATALLFAATALLVATFAIGLVWQSDTRLAVEIAASAFVAAVASMVTAAVLYRIGERETVALEEQLDVARDREVAKGRYLAALGTDLRAPLSGILGFTDHLATDGFTDGRETTEILGLLSRDAADLTRRVENLSVAALIESGGYRPLLEDVSLSNELRSAILPTPESDLTAEQPPNDVVVRADRLALRQILTNVVGNARSHGGPNLRVEIEVRERTAVVSIADDGDGLPSEATSGGSPDRTDGRLIGASAGLGLPVSGALAGAMGGSLDYVRAFGWTSMVITLPLASNQAAGKPGGAHAVGVMDLPVLTVVIDEHDDAADSATPTSSATSA